MKGTLCLSYIEIYTYISKCISVNIYIYLLICIYIYWSIFIFLYLSIYLYQSISICLYLSIYINLYLSIYINISTSIHKYLCICIYLSIYMYISIYLYLYICMYHRTRRISRPCSTQKSHIYRTWLIRKPIKSYLQKYLLLKNIP